MTVVRRILIEGGAVLVLAGFLFLMLHDPGVREVSAVSLYETAVAAGFPDGNAASALTLKRNFGLSPESFEDVLYVAPTGFMDVAELLILRSEDPGLLLSAETAVQNRVEERRSVFQSYAPEEYGLLSRAEIVRRGSYLFLVVCPEAASVRQALLKEVNR